MSAVLDFRDLRDKVLAGEMDEDEEPVETPLAMEAKQKRHTRRHLYFRCFFRHLWI